MSQEDRKPLSVEPDSSMADFETSPTVAAPSRPMSGQWGRIEIGTLVAQRYRIIGTLGVGGMGVVYRAHDQTLDVDIALKVLRPEVADDEGFLQRFRHELVVARRITHRNVIRIHDLGIHLGMHFMTMDMVEGRSLRQIMKREGALPLAQALKILRQVSGALAEAHRQGVVHRDLKPENILIDQDGEAYVTDFGIARSVDTPGLTRTGEIIGTPDYLSPEQARGERVDARSDLYTLGLIFVEMLSGKLPFEGGTLFEVLARRMSADPKTLNELGVEVPAAINDIIEKLIVREPEGRFEDATQLLRSIDNFEQPRRALEQEKRGRRMLAWAVAAALAVGLLGFGLARWWSGGLAPEIAGENRPVAALAVLPFLSSGEGDPWPGLAGAYALSLELAEGPELRVLEPIALLRILQDLGYPTTIPLRNDQLSQLYQVLGVDALVVGEVRSGSGQATFALRYLVEGPSGLESLRLAEPIQLEGSHLFEASLRGVGLIRSHLGLPQRSTSSRSEIEINAWQLFDEGIESFAVRDFESAASLWEQALDTQSNFDWAWFRLAEAQKELGQTEAAARSIQFAINGELGVRLEAKARMLQTELRGDAAEDDAEKAHLEAYPFDLATHREFARRLGDQGRFEEAMAVLERVAEIDARDSKAWFMLGRFALLLGKNQQAVDEYLVRALVRRTRLRDEIGQAEVYNALGVGYQRLGLIDEALDNFESAADIRRQHEDRAGLAAILFNLASIHLMRGEHDRAETNLDQALVIHTELKNLAGIAKLHNARGVLEEERGRHREALEAYRRGLRASKELGDSWAMADSHINVGYAYFLLNEFDNAVLHLDEALDLDVRNGNQSGEMLAIQGLGFCQLAQGQWEDAAESFGKTLDLSGETGRRDAAAVALGNLGRLAHLEGRYETAMASYNEALGILEALGDQRGQIEFQLYVGEAFLEMGDLENAAERARRVGELQSLESLPEQRIQWLILKGMLAEAQGDIQAAQSSLEEAFDQATAQDRQRLAVRARAGLSALSNHAGREEEVMEDLALSYREAERLRDVPLQLQVGERLNEALLGNKAFDEAISLSRQLIDQIEKAGAYGRAYRIYGQLARALKEAGDLDGALLESKKARREIDTLHAAMDSSQKQKFDLLPEVREVLDGIQ